MQAYTSSKTCLVRKGNERANAPVPEQTNVEVAVEEEETGRPGIPPWPEESHLKGETQEKIISDKCCGGAHRRRAVDP